MNNKGPYQKTNFLNKFNKKFCKVKSQISATKNENINGLKRKSKKKRN